MCTCVLNMLISVPAFDHFVEILDVLPFSCELLAIYFKKSS